MPQFSILHTMGIYLCDDCIIELLRLVLIITILYCIVHILSSTVQYPISTTPRASPTKLLSDIKTPGIKSIIPNARRRPPVMNSSLSIDR